MSSILMYEREPYRTELEVEVLTIGDDGGRPFALLSDTVLYPEGGGQPADQGQLGAAKVLDVQKHSDGPRHYFEGKLDTGPATLRLDWPRRLDLMQQHTGQHLLTAIAADRFGWPTTAFHISGEVCHIELAAQNLTRDDLNRLEDAVANEIRAGRPVTDRRVTPEQLADLEVRSRGLPAGHTGDVRLVEIEGIDLGTCGGTHLGSTAEIETLALLGTESMRGGLRLTWVAGGRVRRRLGVQEQRLAELRKVLSASDDELLRVAQSKLDNLKQTTKQTRHLLTQLASATADSLAASGQPLIDRHFDDVDLGFLGQVARKLCGETDDRAAFLTSQDARGAYLLVAAGGASSIDPQAAGRQAAALLDGRGGGSGRIFQGRVESLEKRSEALAVLEG